MQCTQTLDRDIMRFNRGDRMETLKRKLSSRKLWAAVAGVVTGLSIIFGLDGDIITTVSGAIVSLAPILTYIITEGKIDAAAAKQTAVIVQETVDKLEDI